jgi:hypothetical protein
MLLSYVSIRLHTSAAYVGSVDAPAIRHTSAYVSIRQHTAAYVGSVDAPDSATVSATVSATP